MRVYGLTGGIASGKSTVAEMFRGRGAPVIDADALAREIVLPEEPALAEIVTRFGTEVLGPAGTLDRRRLASLVFADPAARRALEAITHPRIAALARRRLVALAGEGHTAAIYEAARLVERRLHEGLDGLIVVAIPPALQRERLISRDGLDPTDADARLEAQLPLDAKLAAATWVIDNAGALARTAAQVDAVWAEMRSAVGG